MASEDAGVILFGLWVYVVGYIVILVYFLTLVYLNRSSDEMSNKTMTAKLWCIDIRHACIIAISGSIFGRGLNALVYTINLGFDETFITPAFCNFLLRWAMGWWSLHKFGIHLFVMVRCRIHIDGFFAMSKLWYKVGLTLLISDLLFILYISIPSPISEASNHFDEENGICEIDTVTPAIFIWLSMNEFVISIYCLITFILPLRRILKLTINDVNESAVHNDSIDVNDDVMDDIYRIQFVVNKIIFWCSLALISTMISTVISIVYNPSSNFVFGFDQLLNCVAMVAQFKIIKPELFDSEVLQKFCYGLQCLYCNPSYESFKKKKIESYSNSNTNTKHSTPKDSGQYSLNVDTNNK